MTLLELYENTLHSVGVKVTGDNYIATLSDKKIKVDGKPLVMPTKEHIGTLTSSVNGEVVIEKALFNPLREDVVKGDSVSLRKLRNIVEQNLCMATYTVMELLLKLASNKKLQSKASIDIVEFLAKTNEVKTKNVKDAIDDSTLASLEKIFDKSLDLPDTDGLLHIYLSRGEKTSQGKYNRVAVINFPIYELLTALNKDYNVYNINLRRKDVGIYKILYEYIFESVKSESTIKIGSNDSRSPGFAALIEAFTVIGSRLNMLLDKLAFVDEETVDQAKFDITISKADLNDLNKYKAELAVIPTEADIFNKSIAKPVAAQPQQQQGVQQPTVQQGYPQQPMMQQSYNRGPNPFGGGQPMMQQGYPQQQMQQDYPQMQQQGFNRGPNPFGGGQPMMQQGYPQQPMMQQGYPQQQMMQGQPMMQQGYPQQYQQMTQQSSPFSGKQTNNLPWN
jgi:hypothetical protein